MVTNGYKWYCCHSNVNNGCFAEVFCHQTGAYVRAHRDQCLCSAVLGWCNCIVHWESSVQLASRLFIILLQMKALDDRVAQHQEERNRLHQQHREVSVWTHSFNVILQEWEFKDLCGLHCLNWWCVYICRQRWNREIPSVSSHWFARGFYWMLTSSVLLSAVAAVLHWWNGEYRVGLSRYIVILHWWNGEYRVGLSRYIVILHWWNGEYRVVLSRYIVILIIADIICTTICGSDSVLLMRWWT